MLDPRAVDEPPGIGWCRAWTGQVDATLATLLGNQRGVAVVALGGYARRELCPASDVDLLLLHDGWGHPDLQQLVEALCYPLWDAHLSVGHAVRTPAQAVADAGERVDTATALLDRRLVAGDRGLYDGLSSRVQRWSRRNGRALLRDLAAADEARHAAAGAAAGMLEPDLKSGAGGLRDVHSLRWAAAVLLGELGLDPLVSAGYLGAEDRRHLAQANATLLRVRTVLHGVDDGLRGKSVDVLRLDRQDEVAARLDDVDDADHLLREVGLATRAVAHLHGRCWDRVLNDAAGGRRRRRGSGRDLGDGLVLADGAVELDPTVDVDADASVGLRAVAAAAANGVHLGRATATSLQRATARPGALSWDAAARRALVQLLSAGDAVTDALIEADHVGLLTAGIPEWSRVRGHPQRNALHRFDVDTHGAEAVVALHALRRSDEIERIWRDLVDPGSVLLATWLHDIGKAWPGDHSVVGAQVAQRWLEAMGFGDETVARATAMVRHHLLLPDTATRRDLDDPAEVEAVARTVATTDVLDGLYLLSLADSRATGPAAWSPWKDSLLATLYRQARRVLTRSDAPNSEDPLQVAIRDGTKRRAVERLAAVAPPRYADVADADQVATHAALLAEGQAVHVRRGRVDGTAVVSIATTDRPRLVADIAGVLAAAEVDVVSAQVMTGAGVALNWFTVLAESIPAELPETLAAALDERVDVAALLARPRRGRPAAASQRPPRVTVRDDTTLEVEAPDAPSLLYRLCGALSDGGYSINAVRALTQGGWAFDVFDVRPAAGAVPLPALAGLLADAAQQAL